MYQCSKKLVTYKECSCFDFPAYLMFTFDVWIWFITFDVAWVLVSSGNSSSTANNTQSRLPTRPFFRFLWLWIYLRTKWSLPHNVTKLLHFLNYCCYATLMFCFWYPRLPNFATLKWVNLAILNLAHFLVRNKKLFRLFRGLLWRNQL